jgi:hypothetical protein
MNSPNERQKAEVHPAADSDIDRQYEWLRDHSCSTSTLHKFLDAIEEAKAKIGNNPETWSKIAGSNKVRKVQIKSFRMTVFYIIRKNKIPLILEFAGPGLLPRWIDESISADARYAHQIYRTKSALPCQIQLPRRGARVLQG